jgi:hypothetical protein
MWARHRALLVRREVPTVPAPVVAQSWPGSDRQALLARLLSGCAVEALDDAQARAAGALAARAATSDIVDASVVEGALCRHDLIVSPDEGDLPAGPLVPEAGTLDRPAGVGSSGIVRLAPSGGLERLTGFIGARRCPAPGGAMRRRDRRVRR